MSSIPASELVAVNPSVLSAGGSALNVIGLLLSNGTSVPVGVVQSFPDATAVSDYFGPNSVEASSAATYFQGFSIASKRPANILFAQYNETAVAAYLRGGAFGLTIAEMQALSGSLTVAVDGYPHVISSISLSSYTSYSLAAAGIQAAFTDPTEAAFTASLGASFTASVGSPTTKLVVTSVTGLISVGDVVTGTGITAGTTIVSQDSGGTPGGAGTYVLSAANSASSASCTTTSTVLNVTVVSDTGLAVGQTLVGSGVTGTPLITALITGTGDIGTYRISGAGLHVASESMTSIATAPLVTYDSVSGAFVVTSGITGTPSSVAFATGTLAAPLLLTSATGAVLSQGAAAASPATFMNSIVDITTDWVNFMTCFDPDEPGENTVKQAFAAWKNTQNNRYGYVCWDTDVTPAQTLPATGSLGYILTNNNDSGTCLIDGQPSIFDEAAGIELASFICGAAASINFDEPAGRITFAYKGQDGIAATTTTSTAANNLGGAPQTANRGNGYNFYGVYGTSFTWFQRGFCTGDFAFFDSYINQIVMNNAFQFALLQLQKNSKSIPYTISGDSLIESALADPIQRFLVFGAFAPGDISQSQIAAVNQAAGANIAGTLQTQGYYLQVLPASSSVRAARTSPPCKFWYLDRGSVQAFTLASVALN